VNEFQVEEKIELEALSVDPQVEETEAEEKPVVEQVEAVTEVEQVEAITEVEEEPVVIEETTPEEAEDEAEQPEA